jgi:hypothetical protein
MAQKLIKSCAKPCNIFAHLNPGIKMSKKGVSLLIQSPELESAKTRIN